MIALGWSVPTNRVDAGAAQRGILWQHQRIRKLLSRACAIAESALDGAASPPEGVASVISALRTTIEVHLAFEEAVLMPLLSDAGTAGRQGAEKLLDEHKRQRGVLVALDKEASAHPRLPTLAAKLAFLARWLLADMDEEERAMIADGNPLR